MEQNWLTIEDQENGVRILTKCSEEAEGEVVIPAGVTRIGEEAFKGCDKITSLVLPEGLNRIGYHAFCDRYKKESYCPALASIQFSSTRLLAPTFLSNNTLLQGTAWYDNQPNGVVYAGVNAIGFKGAMPKNTEVVIKEGTKYISGFAFKNCNNLASIALPKSMECIDDRAFTNCCSLETILFSSDVKLLKRYVSFSKTPWFMNQPNGIVYAGATAYGYKGNMPKEAEIVIKEGIKYIPFRAFALQINIEKVTLPQSIVEIEKEAFEHCENLKSLQIPKMCDLETFGESWLAKDRNFSQLLFESGLKKTDWVWYKNRSPKGVFCINNTGIKSSD